MRLPYRKALLWLFVEGKSDKDIETQLDEISLPILEKADLEEHRLVAESLPLSIGMRRRLSKKQYDVSDYAIASKLGFGEIYCKYTDNYSIDPSLRGLWEDVSKLLRNPVLRIAIDVGILCKYSLDEISQILPSSFHENLSEAGLNLYCKYFFDHDSLTKNDWRQYLRLWATTPYGYVRYYAALTKPREEALFLAGLPTKSEFSDFLKTVMGTAAYKFQHYSRMSTPQSDAQARAWAKIGFDAGVRHDKFSSKDAGDFSKTVQTEFAYTDSSIEDIDPDILSEVRPQELTDLRLENDAPTIPNAIQRETEV
jgi:hypothetical protein